MNIGACGWCGVRECPGCSFTYPGSFDLPSDVQAHVLMAYARVCAVFRANVNVNAPHRSNRTPEEHIYAALSHAVAHLRGRREEDHLAHAAARLLLAMSEKK